MNDARRVLLAVLILAAAGTPGCNRGDDERCLEFTPAGSPMSGAVAASHAPRAGTCDLLELQLLITDVSDVFGVSFELTYDPGIIAFAGVFPETGLLASDGTPLAVDVNGPEGAVSIGVSRIGPDGISATGTRILLLLRFSQLTDVGVTTLTFVQPKVLGSETPPQVKLGISWTGGTIEVL